MSVAEAPRVIRRGDLYWARVPRAEEPGADGAASAGAPIEQPIQQTSALLIAHPHVVVQDDLFNRSRIATVVVMALTSNRHRASEPGNVLLEPGEGGLARQSVVVVSQITSIAKAELGERIGSLSEPRVEQILEGLRFLQRSFFER
jgi:mRNA interferase MazF